MILKLTGLGNAETMEQTMNLDDTSQEYADIRRLLSEFEL
jgi:hypothetical protein